LSHRPVIPSDEEVARVWARLAANAQRRGRPRPQNDTWVAACCVRHGLPLITLNTKDFEDFARHEGLVMLGDDAGDEGGRGSTEP
jgi:toxin FitB